jgi:hypothetical protein
MSWPTTRVRTIRGIFRERLNGYSKCRTLNK